eukprot:7068821-Alexandrium_andersonii.AAC.1
MVGPAPPNRSGPSRRYRWRSRASRASWRLSSQSAWTSAGSSASACPSPSGSIAPSSWKRRPMHA